jgi:hypothetical protein
MAVNDGMLGRVFQLEILVPATRVAYEADLLFPATALRKNALTFCFSVVIRARRSICGRYCEDFTRAGVLCAT